jgi:hypothetical protein
MATCDHCHQPIHPEERPVTHEVMSPTGPGHTVVWHAWPCRQPKQFLPPTFPSGPGAR